MAFQRAILPAVLSWADKLVMIGKYWNTYLIACQCYIYYIAYTGAPSEYSFPQHRYVAYPVCHTNTHKAGNSIIPSS